MAEEQTIKKPFYKDTYFILFVAILIFAVFIRVYFFSQAYTQTFWWDSAEYGLKAKAIAFGTPTTGWAPERELVVPYILSVILSLGFGEMGMLILQLLVSIVTIIVTYITISKITSSKTTGLIAMFGMTFFWLHIFFTQRVLLYLWAPLIFLAIIHFFYKGYVQNNKKYLILFALMSAIGLMTYFSVGFLLAGIFLYLLITERFSLLKNKKAWFALGIFILALSPYMIYSQITFGFPIPRLQVGVGAAINEHGAGLSGLWGYITMIPSRVGWAFTIASIMGMLSFLYVLALEFSLEKYKGWLLTFICFIIPLFFYTLYGIMGGEGVFYDAFILPIFPFMFAFIGFIIERYEPVVPKTVIILVILALFAIHAYTGITQSNLTIMSKISSYDSVKEAGLWIKSNSEPGDIVVSMSRSQNTYYSERETVRIPETQQEFKELISNDVRIKYFIVSVWENHPKWIYDYVSSNSSLEEITPVQAYFLKENQPSLIIYQINHQSSQCSINNETGCS